MSSYPVSLYDYSFTFLLRLLSEARSLKLLTDRRSSQNYFAYSAPSRGLSARVIRSLNRITVLGLTIRFSRCCALCPRLACVPLSATAWLLYLSQQQMSSLFAKKSYFCFLFVFSFVHIAFFAVFDFFRPFSPDIFVLFAPFRIDLPPFHLNSAKKPSA